MKTKIKSLTFFALVILLTGNLQAQSNVPATASGVIRGDMNFDGLVNNQTQNGFGETDQSAFINAMDDGAAYASRYQAPASFKGDANDDGLFSALDVEPFGRLLAPMAPYAKKSLLTRLDQAWTFQGLISTAYVGRGVVSANGRYVVFNPQSPEYENASETLVVHDTYTDTKFKIRLPAPYGLDGYLMGSFDISADGRYLALTGMVFNAAHTAFNARVFRYDLKTGEAIRIESLPFSWYPSITSDGSKIIFRSFVNNRQYVYVTDVTTMATTQIAEINPNANTLQSASPDISDNGRYILVPYASLGVPLETSRGLLLIDTVAMTVRELIHSKITGSSTPSEKNILFDAAISDDGRTVVYSDDRMLPYDSTFVHFYSTETQIEMMADAGNSTTVGVSVSSDGRYISYNNKIHWIAKNYTYTLPSTPFNDSGGAPGAITLSGNGRYFTYGSMGGTGYIVPNPVYVSAITGDYNQNGCVDAADYVLWRKSLSSTVVIPGTSADGNSNGTVDQADYDLYRTNIGQGCTTAAPGSGSLHIIVAPAPTHAPAPAVPMYFHPIDPVETPEAAVEPPTAVPNLIPEASNRAAIQYLRSKISEASSQLKTLRRNTPRANNAAD